MIGAGKMTFKATTTVVVFYALVSWVIADQCQGHCFEGRCVLASQWSTKWHIICQPMSGLWSCFDSK